MSSASKPAFKPAAPVKHVFTCPVCGGRGHSDVCMQRTDGSWITLRPLRQCSTCSLVFLDAQRLTFHGHLAKKALVDDVQRHNRLTGDY